jgi:hypothetical protein
MIPIQNYNVAAYFTQFLKDCVAVSSVNGLGVEHAARIFGQAFLRTHGIISIDETERQQSSTVFAYMISDCDRIFPRGPFLDVTDKDAESARKKRRKKAKEMLSNFAKNENRKLRKEQREQNKQRKMRGERGKNEPDIVS